jgi:hypothetical protein
MVSSVKLFQIVGRVKAVSQNITRSSGIKKAPAMPEVLFENKNRVDQLTYIAALISRISFSALGKAASISDGA